jgi:hypothetical protein
MYCVNVSYLTNRTSAENVKFRAGSSYLETNGTLYPAVELIGHPLFDYYTLDYDVGLGKVSDNVVQNVIKNSVNLFKNCL